MEATQEDNKNNLKSRDEKVKKLDEEQRVESLKAKDR